MPRRRTAANQIADDWRSIYQTDEGRRAIAELFKAAGVYDQINPSDPIAAGIAIGQRNVAVRIALWIGLKPEEFADVVEEDVNLVDKIIRDYSRGERV